MQHYQNPSHKGFDKNDSSLKVEYSKSPSCIDEVYLASKIKNNIIEYLKFDGVGCAICMAASDILCDLLNGVSLQDAEKILDEYHKLLINEDFDENLVKELIAFVNVHKQLNRVKCASLTANLINEKLLDKKYKY